jgi:hypothetical protein
MNYLKCSLRFFSTVLQLKALYCCYIYNNLQSTWTRSLLGNLTIAQLVNKFPFFYGTRTLMACSRENFTYLLYLYIHYYVHKNHHRTLLWASRVHSTIQYHISLIFILILSYYLCLGLPSGLFPPTFPTMIVKVYLFSPVWATCLPGPDGWLCLNVVNFDWYGGPIYQL